MQWSAHQLVQCHPLTGSRNRKLVSYHQAHILSPAAPSHPWLALTLDVALRMKAGFRLHPMTCATART